MDRGIVLKIEEEKILSTVDDMCAESLDPDTFNKWEDVKFALKNTRHRLSKIDAAIAKEGK